MTDQQALSGQRFLFDHPELLTKEDHGHLGLNHLAQPFAFAKDVRAVPLLVSEIRSAQRHCPVVFSDGEDPFPMAVLGVLEDRNLFLDDSGHWQEPGYVPAYLRCYPFALANAATDQFALVVDRSAAMVGEAATVPFFDGDRLSRPVQERLELCRLYQTEELSTDAFCKTLKSLDLLVQQEAHYAIEGQVTTIARYATVHQDRLRSLDPNILAELMRNGSLAAIMAQLFSLENFGELVRLRQLRRSNSS
jgi:hypothetical protein